MVKHFLSAGREQEQGYKACVSLKKLGEHYSKERLEKACTRMLELSGTPSIRNITTILRGQQEKPAANSSGSKESAAGQYAITRGAAYYGKGGKNNG